MITQGESLPLNRKMICPALTALSASPIYRELRVIVPLVVTSAFAEEVFSPISEAIEWISSSFFSASALGYEASLETADDIINIRGGNAEYFYKMFKGKIPDGTGVAGGTTTDGQPVSAAGDARGGSYAVTADCPITAPIYGKGGNGKQLKQASLESIYGKGGPAVEPNLITMDFLGKTVRVHKLVAGCLQAVIDDIKKADINYTVKVIGGYREEKGGGNVDVQDGYHYYGVAIDINPDQNGFYQGGASHPFDMPRQYVDIFHAHGWSWGGNWDSVKDYMHFEFNGLAPK